jgi:hypothetical protein
LARYGCDHCCDTYDEDNLIECARCGADTCWRCAIHAELPGLAEGTWWCHRCLKKVGREDLLKGNGPQKVNASEETPRVSVGNLWWAIAVSQEGTLKWPAEGYNRQEMVKSLLACGMDLNDNGKDFVGCPRETASRRGYADIH